jgi:hypothetical protein
MAQVLLAGLKKPPRFVYFYMVFKMDRPSAGDGLSLTFKETATRPKGGALKPVEEEQVFFGRQSPVRRRSKIRGVTAALRRISFSF